MNRPNLTRKQALIAAGVLSVLVIGAVASGSSDTSTKKSSSSRSTPAPAFTPEPDETPAEITEAFCAKVVEKLNPQAMGEAAFEVARAASSYDVPGTLKAADKVTGRAALAGYSIGRIERKDGLDPQVSASVIRLVTALDRLGGVEVKYMVDLDAYNTMSEVVTSATANLTTVCF